MQLEICWRNLRDKKRALLAWSIGLALLTFFTMAFWPSIRGNAQYDKLLKQMPDTLKAFVGDQPFSTPEGYLQAQLFLYVVPVLFMIYAIGRGADAIAGEEERRTMDLLLSVPVGRGRVVLEKFAAMVVGVGLLGLILLILLELCAKLFDMNIGFENLAAATLGSALLGLVFGAVALAVSASVGKKGLAVATAAALATAAFFINSIARVVDALKTYQKLSPFHWYLSHSPLENGFDLPGYGLLIAAVVILLAISVTRFERRDVAI